MKPVVVLASFLSFALVATAVPTLQPRWCHPICCCSSGCVSRVCTDIEVLDEGGITYCCHQDLENVCSGTHQSIRVSWQLTLLGDTRWGSWGLCIRSLLHTNARDWSDCRGQIKNSLILGEVHELAMITVREGVPDLSLSFVYFAGGINQYIKKLLFLVLYAVICNLALGVPSSNQYHDHIIKALAPLALSSTCDLLTSFPNVG